MFDPCTAIVAFLVRSTAPVALVLACLWSTRVQSQPPVGTKNDRPAAVPQSVEVFGKVVDAETGKPVEAFITQAGKFDPKDPKNVTWGFSETRNTSGGFSATIKWNEGWTARILADGYVPQPVLSEAPPAGKDRIETVIRLKKGRIVRGRVLDHLGKPVKDASVFAVRSNRHDSRRGAGRQFLRRRGRPNRPRGEDRFRGAFRAGCQRCRGTGASGRRSAGIRRPPRRDWPYRARRSTPGRCRCRRGMRKPSSAFRLPREWKSATTSKGATRKRRCSCSRSCTTSTRGRDSKSFATFRFEIRAASSSPRFPRAGTSSRAAG